MSDFVNEKTNDFQIENGVLIRYNGNKAEVEIPEGITGIGNGSSMTFFQTNAEKVIVPDSVTYIGGYAFFGCNTLTSVSIPDSVKSIGHHAFRQCSSLKEIEIPDGVETIERECFWGCVGLKSIRLPASLKVIEEKAFSGCTSASEIVIPAGTEKIEAGAFWGDGCLERITIPDSVTSIGEMAFCDCNRLTIIGATGSSAEKYAKENSIPFKVGDKGKAPDHSLSKETGKDSSVDNSGGAISNLHLFFESDVTGWLLENCGTKATGGTKYKSGDDFSFDIIEQPFHVKYSVEGKEVTIRIYVRTEIGTLPNPDVTLKIEPGGKPKLEAKGKIRDTDTIMTFFNASLALRECLRANDISEKYKDLNLESEGIMISLEDDCPVFKKVAGRTRPDLMCTTLFGAPMMTRPYAEDFMERSALEMMSLEEKIKAAENGNQDAMEQLAMAWLNGDADGGIEADPEKAFYWFQKLAEAGNATGMFNLGLFYAKGYATERDFSKALEWMKKAAEAGDEDAPRAAEEYGKLTRAKSGAEAGDAQAQADLAGGLMALGGSLEQAGVGKDYAESVSWAEKSAAQGNGDGIWVLALAYEHGRGVEKDVHKAIELYRRGAELGHAKCQHSLGCYYLRGDVLPKDEKKGFELSLKSAEQGYGLGMKTVGSCYQFATGCTGNMKTAVEWYEKALEVIDDPELARKVAAFKQLAKIDPSFGEDYDSGEQVQETQTGQGDEEGDSEPCNIVFKDRIFVLTGYAGTRDEGRISEIIQSRGGIIKSSTVLKTDYLIYDEQSGVGTTKYRRAVELNGQGKNIQFITGKRFLKSYSGKDDIPSKEREAVSETVPDTTDIPGLPDGYLEQLDKVIKEEDQKLKSLNQEAGVYLEKMKGRFASARKSWEAFSEEVPKKILDLAKQGLKPTISRNTGSSASGSRTIGITLNIDSDMTAAKKYIESLKTEIPERSKVFREGIDEFEARLLKYQREGNVQASVMSALAAHFVEWINYASDLHIQMKDRRIDVQMPERYPALKKEWERIASAQSRKADAEQYGIAEEDLEKHKEYLAASRKREQAKTSLELFRVEAQFRNLKGYRDSEKLADEIHEKALTLQQEEENARQAELERERKEQQEIEQYAADYQAWKEECEQVQKERQQLQSEKLNALWAKLEGTAKASLESVVEKLKQDIAAQEKKQSDAESALASLGIFKMSAKKEQKAIIEDARSRITSLWEELHKAERELNQMISEANAELKKAEPQIREEVQQELPLPEEPVKPQSVKLAEYRKREEERRKEQEEKRRKEQEEQENRRKYGLYYKEEEAIYKYLKSTGKRMTATELAEEFNMSNQRTSTVVTSLVKKGKLARYVDKRKAYFEAVD